MMDNYFGFKKTLICLFLASFLMPVSAQTSFTQGEAFFIQNRPRDALEFLETATREDPAHIQAFLYLGITYQQLDRIDDAIAVYRKILDRGGSETARIAFSLGNAYLKKGEQLLAVQSYTQALEADPGYSAALLNRANVKVQMGSLREAVDDYEYYLQIEPGSSQASQIRRLISFIQEEFAFQERRRLEEIAAAERRRLEEIAAEERRIQEEEAAAEQARLAAAEAARRETERRQRLLDEVTASLQASAEESRSLSAGNEGIQSYDGEFELE